MTTNLDRQFDAGRAQIYGLEAMATHEPRIASSVRLPLTASYTLTRGEFLDTFQSQDPIYGDVRRGDALPYIPLHQLGVTAAAEHRRGGLTAAAYYVAPMREQASRAPIDQALATDEQLWLDLGAHVNVLPWLRIYANPRNAPGAENVIGRRAHGARANPSLASDRRESTFLTQRTRIISRTCVLQSIMTLTFIFVNRTFLAGGRTS